MRKSKKKSKWIKTRKFFNDLHLWLGLLSGIILFLVCLSGTVLTFKDDINQLISPSNYKVEAPLNSEKLSVERLIKNVESQTNGVVTVISIPAKENATYVLNVKTKDGGKRGTNYFVNPYTADLIGDGKGVLSDFFMTIFKLHRWLLLDISIGRPIVGIATLIFVFMLISGMIIWIPNKVKHWRQGLKIKTRANFKRLNHDLHNTLGFYAFILMLIMALSGLFWSFEWYREGASHLLGTEVFNREKSSIESNIYHTSNQLISIEELINQSKLELPYEGDCRIYLPTTKKDVFKVEKNSIGFFAFAGSDQLFIDQYGGEIIHKNIFSEKPLNKQIAALIKPIHMGYVFGTFSKILYFIACLIATSLPITGTIIWINKLKKKKKRRTNSFTVKKAQ